MANYYTQFSFVYQFLTMEKAKKAEELFNRVHGVYANLVDITAEYSIPAVGVIGEDGSIEEVLDTYAILCIEHGVTGVLCFTWSHTCSSMRTDGFGGGIATTAFDGDQMITHVSDFVGNEPGYTGLVAPLPHTGFAGYNTEYLTENGAGDD